uniref:Uncharacterized protein n=1 Tax=Arundo donax TaxID=35708 RepID=A0A0A9GZK6_ARUDO
MSMKGSSRSPLLAGHLPLQKQRVILQNKDLLRTEVWTAA